MQAVDHDARRGAARERQPVAQDEHVAQEHLREPEAGSLACGASEAQGHTQAPSPQGHACGSEMPDCTMCHICIDSSIFLDF